MPSCRIHEAGGQHAGNHAFVQSRIVDCRTLHSLHARCDLGLIDTMHCACSVGLPLQQLDRAITPAVAAQLERDGFAVVDCVFGTEPASSLRREITHLHQARLRLGIPGDFYDLENRIAATARHAAWRMTWRFALALCANFYI